MLIMRGKEKKSSSYAAKRKKRRGGKISVKSGVTLSSLCERKGGEEEKKNQESNPEGLKERKDNRSPS